MSRLVCWFSCGATSAVAARLALIENARIEINRPESHVVYIDTGSEHPDNRRFLRDVEGWLKHPIEIIKSKEYADIWDVFRRTRWLVGPDGARCTTELKKLPRREYQRPDDIQVFGFDTSETKRIGQFRGENPDVDLRVPLMDRGLSKSDCLAILTRDGIVIPATYRLGFKNANCLGCVKGGMGYWNKIRREFPDVFDRMAKMEREIDAAICHRELPRKKGQKRGDRVNVFLDELDPLAGRDDESVGECSIMCLTAEREIAEQERSPA